MRESSSDFRGTFLELIDASPRPPDHPSADRWLAYHRGELPEAEEARLQEHLVRCRDCFDLAAAAAEFDLPDEAPDEAPEAGQEVDTAAVRRRLEPQPAADSASARGNVREISSVPRQPSWKLRLPSILAASFFAALVGVTTWSLQLQRTVGTLRAPQPNVPIFDVSSGERVPTSPELTVPGETRMFVFHPPEELPAYRLVISDPATGRAVSSTEHRLDEDLALTLYLPEGLPPGRYRLELSDGAGGRVLETRLLRVTEPGEGE